MFKKSPSFSVQGKKFNLIVLAAGVGSRLRPETDYIPKVLIEVGGMRAIDYIIQKYQYVVERLILATGYGADLVENYVRGKYSALNPIFSREKVSELAGPGRSLIYALDYASSRLPTIITFCDYIIEDYVPVDQDALGISQKPEPPYVVDSHPKGLAVVEEGVVIDLIENKNLEKPTYNGFIGLAICHDTLLLKAITYTKACQSSSKPDYTFDIIRTYISKIKTLALPLSRMFEFGTPEMLEEVRKRLGEKSANSGGNYKPSRTD